MKILLSIFAVIFISASSLFAQTGEMTKYHYKLKTDKLELNFQEVGGLSSEAQVKKENRGGNSKVSPTVKMPGLKKFGNITLLKGIALNTKMNSDLTTFKPGPMTVELVDEQGTVSMVWSLTNAHFVKLVKAANGREFEIESLEIAHEGISIKN